MDCLFCSIVRHKIPAQVVYEDNHATAFLDIHPHAPGHVLVVPARHAETLVDLAEAEIGPLFNAVRRMAGLLVERLKADGLTVGINQGKAAGQAIEHLHVHLIPRWSGDGGGSIHSIVKNPSQETLEQIAQKLM